MKIGYNFNLINVCEDSFLNSAHTEIFTDIYTIKKNNAIDSILESINDASVVIINLRFQECLKILEAIKIKFPDIYIICFIEEIKEELFLSLLKLKIDEYHTGSYYICDSLENISRIKKLYSKKYYIEHQITIKIDNDIYWNKLYKKLYVKGESVKLTPREESLLNGFMLQNGRTFSSEQMQDCLIADSEFNGSENKNKIKIIVYRLNEKFGSKLIQSVYGHGYKLNIIPH